MQMALRVCGVSEQPEEDRTPKSTGQQPNPQRSLTAVTHSTSESGKRSLCVPLKLGEGHLQTTALQGSDTVSKESFQINVLGL